MEESEIGPHVTRTRKIFDDLSKVGVPVIAAMDGAALGWHLHLYNFFKFKC